MDLEQKARYYLEARVQRNEKATPSESRLCALRKGNTSMSSVSQSGTPKQLPNTVREAFLGTDAGKTAIILDLLFTLGYRPGQWVTYAECVNVASEHTAIHIIREGLQHWTIKRKALPQERRGRPTIAYLIPSIDALKNELTVEMSHVSDPLQLQDFANQKAYRQALHREMIKRNYEANNNRPFQMSRKLMSERLNVTPSTLRAYEHELGTYVEARYGWLPIQRDIHLLSVPETKTHCGKSLIISMRGEQLGILPAVRSIAGMYRKKGYDVALEWRKTNAYAPYSPYSARGKEDRHGKYADIVNR